MGSSMKNRYKLMVNPNSYGRAACSAYGCDMRCGTNALSEIKMFYFPRDPLRRRRWELATRRANWKSSNKSRLCSKHFITGKPSKDPKHPDYVPSIFVFSKKAQNLKNSDRSSKLKNHGKLSNSEATCHGNTSSEGTCSSCGVKFFCSKCLSSESVSTAFNISLASLNQTLTELMVKLKDLEEEREQLRNKLASCREEILQFREAHQHCMIQSQSNNNCSLPITFGPISSTTSDDAHKILESMCSGESTDESEEDSLPSLFLEQNYHQSDKPRKKRLEDSNFELKHTCQSSKSGKSSDSNSPITIVYLKR